MQKVPRARESFKDSKIKPLPAFLEKERENILMKWFLSCCDSVQKFTQSGKIGERS